MTFEGKWIELEIIVKLNKPDSDKQIMFLSYMEPRFKGVSLCVGGYKVDHDGVKKWILRGRNREVNEIHTA